MTPPFLKSQSSRTGSLDTAVRFGLTCSTEPLTLVSLCVLVRVVCVFCGSLHGYLLLLATVLLKNMSGYSTAIHDHVCKRLDSSSPPDSTPSTWFLLKKSDLDFLSVVMNWKHRVANTAHHQGDEIHSSNLHIVCHGWSMLLLLLTSDRLN